MRLLQTGAWTWRVESVQELLDDTVQQTETVQSHQHSEARTAQ